MVCIGICYFISVYISVACNALYERLPRKYGSNNNKIMNQGKPPETFLHTWKLMPEHSLLQCHKVVFKDLFFPPHRALYFAPLSQSVCKDNHYQSLRGCKSSLLNRLWRRAKTRGWLNLWESPISTADSWSCCWTSPASNTNLYPTRWPHLASLDPHCHQK